MVQEFLRKLMVNMGRNHIRMMSVLLREINGKYMTGLHSNEASIFEGNEW